MINLDEIKSRALQFAKDWKDTSNEEADAKSFMDAFFNVFGAPRRQMAYFEHRIKKISGADGYIDLYWKSNLVVEMKSKGKNLDNAFTQAKSYLKGLTEIEQPKFILVCDFENFRLYDLQNGDMTHFKLIELVDNVRLFDFIADYEAQQAKEQELANIKAAELMGKLHDQLEANGYKGHQLEVYLVRLLFCLFAEDTQIFEDKIFLEYIKSSQEDGKDLGKKLQELFKILNQETKKRNENLASNLAQFDYINGGLFKENFEIPIFDKQTRLCLLECCRFDWAKISPAIFGSMFQSVMNPTERRNLGAHYTSEANILKVIEPLFMKALNAEFQKIKENQKALEVFHNKIANLRFLDPACGCGNFLIVIYRELRLLELDVITCLQTNQLKTKGMAFADIQLLFRIDVDKFYGIEYEEFPSRIAEVAMWLIDHQMNRQASSVTGKILTRIPLVKSANITHGNALQTDWEKIIKPKNLSYIIGNPPFIGAKIMKQEQRSDVVKVFENASSAGVLDYVTAWYVKAAKYIQNTAIKVAFVSTNSIVQGEQVSIFWGQMLHKYKIKIHFAHRTFKWSNEAKGNAAVYCVIVGFAAFDTNQKSIFDYEDIKGKAHEIKVKNINPYLVDAKDILIDKKSNPICDVPKMVFGNMPNDDGQLLFSDAEYEDFVTKTPKASKFMRPLISAYEFLNGQKRWCLWLVGANIAEIKAMPEVLKRIDAIKKYRLKSTRDATRKLADYPSLFGEIRQPTGEYILIPSTTSENREYIPIGFFGENDIANNSCHIIPDGTLYHFGVLTSKMHVAWVKSVCGRLKSDFRYSKDIVYNNFPWAEAPTDKQKTAIEKVAQKVLDIRAKYANSSLADMYDARLMPADLRKAHQELDKSVDLSYRLQAFVSEATRMEFLFALYEKYTAGLFVVEKKKRVKKS